ncbi:MAG: FeoA family protein [Hydrogenoanaerobacterium sp.]
MNEKSLTLYKTAEGETVQVSSLQLAGSMRRRLQDIGLTIGTSVRCLQKSPSGDPVAYLIRGAVIALRSEDSSRIIVSASDAG